VPGARFLRGRGARRLLCLEELCPAVELAVKYCPTHALSIIENEED
jgi:ferredoxin